MLSSVKCVNILLMSVLVRVGLWLKKEKFNITNSFVSVLAIGGCKKAYTTQPQHNTGSMLQVELRMPVAWKRIVIGPTHSIEYPKIPQRFSMFMTGESTGALKTYLVIEDSTGKEYSILLITVTHANKSQTET